MLSHTDLKKGITIIYDNQPHTVIDVSFMFQGRGQSTSKAKLKNLITGANILRTFHASESFEEIELEKRDIKFVYQNKGQYVFCEPDDPSKRFSFTEKQIGTSAKYLKPNEIVRGIVFNDETVSFELPIKVHLKVKEAPPGVKGDRAEGGSKEAVLESGAVIQVPLFVKAGDTIEINTETGTYVKRI